MNGVTGVPIPFGRFQRRPAVSADRAAGTAGAAAGLLAGGRPTAHREGGGRFVGHQPEYGGEGLPSVGERGAGERPAGAGHLHHRRRRTGRARAVCPVASLAGAVGARCLCRGPGRRDGHGHVRHHPQRAAGGGGGVSAALAAEGLGLRYGSTWALCDCDLHLPAGSVIALVGPNGAGKTTLLHLITGLLRPTRGTVTVLGKDAGDDSAEALSMVGFVVQEHPLYRSFTVVGLLRMGRSLNLRWDQAKAERRLAELGILLTKRAGQLSGGQQAQVALALALAKRPALLVLDEPLAYLDPVARRDFMRALMAVVAEDEITMLLSSHVIADLEAVCDWLVLLRDGRVQLAGAIDDVLAEHRVFTGRAAPPTRTCPAWSAPPTATATPPCWPGSPP